MMSSHQQLWSLECSVVETVASLFRGMTEHCLVWTQSQCPDKVDDIQAVRKSSIYQCISSGPLLFSVDQWKDTSFSIPRNSYAYHHLFQESGFRMVQPFWWNVSVSVGVSWNGKTDIFFIDPQKKQKWTRTVSCYWKRLHAFRKQNGGAIQHIFR